MRFIFAFLFIPFVVTAQSTDTTLFKGNWLRTDGSNLMHIGFYPGVICYDNAALKINSSKKSNGVLYLEAEGKSRKYSLAIKPVNANTIEVTDGKRKTVVSNKRTFHPKFKPEQKTFRAAYGNTKSAHVEGVYHSASLQALEYELRYLSFEFKNELTNDTDYFMAELDDRGRFEINIEIYRPRIVDIVQGRKVIASVMLQPGTSALVAINNTVQLNQVNPDFNDVAQRVNTMGEDAAFNNHYQHFVNYRALYGFPVLNFPEKTVSGLSIEQKKNRTFQWFSDKQREMTVAIDYVYPKSKVEQRFIDFIKDEVRYTCGAELNGNLRGRTSDGDYSKFSVDSADVARIRSEYLSLVTNDALFHEEFYRLVRNYVSRIEHLKFGSSRSYSINPAKVRDRIVNEYGPMLSGNFVETYLALERDQAQLRYMSEKDFSQKYFNGSEKEAQYFMTIKKRIESEFFQETRDTINYEFNRTAYKDPLLLYLANLSVLNDGNSDRKVQSVFRIKLFRRYSKNGAGPWHLVDSIRNANALLTGFAGLMAKSNTLITDVPDETAWQEVLSRYKGKTVVLWMFSHYYRKEYAASSLYEFQRVKKMYDGKNVVFIKGMQERSRNDAPDMLLNYINLFQSNRELSDVYYLGGTLSTNADIRWAVNEVVVIYDENGHVHRPKIDSYKYLGATGGKISVVEVLDNVIAGKANISEVNASVYFPFPRGQSSYGSSVEPGLWTLHHQSGKFYTYLYKEPERPDSRRPDSVFNQLKFHFKDTTLIEQSLVLKKGKKYTDGASRLLYGNEYVLTRSAPINTYDYTYDKKNFTLTLTNKSNKERRRYRVVNISSEMMLLEFLD